MNTRSIAGGDKFVDITSYILSLHKKGFCCF